MPSLTFEINGLIKQLGSGVPIIDDTGLIAYWQMEEASGTTDSFNSTLNKSRSVDSGGAIWDWDFGVEPFQRPSISPLVGFSRFAIDDAGYSLGKEFTFDSTQLVPLSGKDNSFALNFWVKFSLQHDTALMASGAKSSTNIAERGIFYKIDDGTKHIDLEVRDGSGGLALKATSVSTVIPTDTTNWHMYTVMYDKINDEAIFIIDGDVSNKEIVSNTGTSSFPSAGVTFNSVFSHSTNDGTALQGFSDEFSCWTRLLTDEEIETLYNEGQGITIYSGGNLTVDVDALVGVTGEVDKTFKSDVLLKETNKIKPFTIDAETGTGIEKEFKIDSRLVFRKAVNSAITDALISEAINKLFIVDVILQSGQLFNFIIDALIQQPKAKLVSVNAILQGAFDEDFVVDSLPKAEDSVIFNIDGLVKGTQILEYSIDTKIIDANQKITLIDGIISPARTEAFLIDGITIIPIPQSILSVESVIGHKTGLQS